MDLFSSWMFWVGLVIVLVILALIGYLFEKRKNGQKEEPKVKQEIKKEPVKVPEVNTIVSSSIDDWTSMPKITSVNDNVLPGNENDSVNNAITETPVDNLNVSPVNEVSISNLNSEVMPTVDVPAENLNISEPVDSASVNEVFTNNLNNESISENISTTNVSEPVSTNNLDLNINNEVDTLDIKADESKNDETIKNDNVWNS